MRLKLITPPAVEPITATEAKLHARIDISDDNSLVGDLITTAREYCEGVNGHAFITQTWELVSGRVPGEYENQAAHASAAIGDFDHLLR